MTGRFDCRISRSKCRVIVYKCLLWNQFKIQLNVNLTLSILYLKLGMPFSNDESCKTVLWVFFRQIKFPKKLKLLKLKA